MPTYSRFLPFLLLLLLLTHVTQSQCPNISSTTMTPIGCDVGCTLCEGDVITLSATGFNLPNGGEIQWYIDQSPGFDPYSGEGTLLGTSQISTPVTPCNPPPSFIGMMIDACGPEAANEFMVFDAGGGFDVDDLLIDFDMNNNGGAGNDDLGNGFPCGFAPGNPNLIEGCDEVYSISPGEQVPAGAILVLFTSTGSSTTYNMSGICPDCRKVYVLSSNCVRTKGAFSNYTSSGTRTTNWSVACGGGGSITYDCADLIGNGDQWVNGGVTNGTCDFEGGASPYQALSNITPFTTTVPNSWCNEDFEIVGILSSWQGSTCCDDPYTERFTLHVSCPQATATRMEACDKGDGTADFDLSSVEFEVNGGTGYTVEWYEDPGLRTPIFSPYNSSSKTIYAIVRDGQCISSPTQVELTVLPWPVFAGDQQVELCERPSTSGTAPLSLDSLRSVINLGDNSLNIQFWVDMGHTSEIFDDPYTTSSGVLYFTVDNGICTGEGNIIIIVHTTPQAFPQRLMVCEDPPGSGTSQLDLDALRQSITTGNPNDVAFYTQKDTNTQIFSPYKTGSATLYARVEASPCPSDWVEIEIAVLGNIDPEDAVVRLCATSADSTATFTLQELYDQINHGRPLMVFADSLGTQDAVFPYTGRDTLFYGQLENDSCTSGLFRITLYVTGRPELTSTVAQACTDTNNLAAFSLNSIRPLFTTIDSTVELHFSTNPLMTDTLREDKDTIWSGRDTVLYVVGYNGGCYSDTATLRLHPVATPYIAPLDLEGCDAVLLPPILGRNLSGKEAYYSMNQGAGMKWLAGDTFYTSQKLYVYDRNRFCYFEREINVLIHPSVHAGNDVAQSVCKGTEVDLTTLLEGADSGGAFRQVSPNGNLMGNRVNTTDMDTGTYIYRYTRYSGTVCPDDSATLTLKVVDRVDAGSDIQAPPLCLSDTLDLGPLLTGDLGGEVRLWPGGQLLGPGETVIASQLGEGEHQLIYIIGDGNTCPKDTAFIQVEVNPIVIIPPVGNTSVCAPFVFPPITSSGGSPAYYSEPAGNGTRYLPGDTLFNDSDIFITDPNNPCSEEVDFHVAIGAPTFNNINGVLCSGTGIDINGTTYDKNHPAGREVLPGQNRYGCDSIINIALQFYPLAVHYIDTTLCPGESMIINGVVYDARRPAGMEIIPGGSVHQCDSSIFIQLSFYKTDTTISGQYCNGEEISIGGQVFNSSYSEDTLVLAGRARGGCDSTIRVHLQFADAVEANYTNTICRGDSIVVNGVIYSEHHTTGTDTFPKQSARGCDSILHISIDVLQPAYAQVHPTLCPEEFILIGGNTYNLEHPSGTEIIPNGAANGCDSVIDISLSFFQYFLASRENQYEIETGGQIQPEISTDMPYQTVQWTPQQGLSCIDCIDPIISPDQTTEYTLTLTDSNGCMLSTSLTIVVREKTPGGLYIPNTFSPNGDGQNDRFKVFADQKEGGILLRFEVYDRWGEIVYLEENTEVGGNSTHIGWDGKLNGLPLLPGVYIYRALFQSATNQKVTEKVGSITLIR